MLVAQGAGIGFVANYNAPYWPGVRRVLPQLIAWRGRPFTHPGRPW